MKEKPIFLSGLNGIRTIAAIGVLISHVNLALPKFNIKNFSLFGFSNEGKTKGWMLGEHGVTMFFVLSGFLITYLLLKEYKKTNTINIKAFYVRRALRIWPLYYFYLLITILISFFILSSELPSPLSLFFYSFFLANVPFINENALPALDHFWSIGVEEQFYLFWPFLFLFFNKRFKSIIILLILLQALFRIYIWYKFPFSTIALLSVVNRFDCMMFGGLGALFYLEKSKLISFLNRKFAQYFSWLIILLLVVNKLNFFNSIIEIFLIGFVTMCIIIGQIGIENRIVNLENKIMSYLGKLSFGIYVYHPLLILLFSHFFKNKGYFSEITFAFMLFIIILGLTIIISHFSYFYFENRFLKLKSKFSIIHSTNSNV
jgi:peptidoglycan/LPS O-acetylase OafA/YrhL